MHCMCYTSERCAVDAHCGLHTVHPELNVVDTEACMCRVCPNITICVRMSIGSRNRTIHNAFHISLHVSSGTEPTHQSRHTWSTTCIHSSTHIMNTCRLHKTMLLWLHAIEHMNIFTCCNAAHANTCITPAHHANSSELCKCRCGYVCSPHPDIQCTSQRDPLSCYIMWEFNCARMILPQVHLRKPCYDFSFL